MIQLECSNCQTMLSIDDAFAGGVCRCQFCGTIQTVPKPSQNSSEAATVTSSKALFKRKARIDSALSPYNDGLARAVDELASSSGLIAMAGLNAASKRPTKSSDHGVGSSVTGGSQTGATPRHSESAASASKGPKDAQRAAATAPAPPQVPPVAKPHFVPKPSAAAAAPARAPLSDSLRSPMVVGLGAIVLIVGAVLWWALSGDHNKPEHMTPATQIVPAPMPKPTPAPTPAPAPAPAPSPARELNPAATTLPGEETGPTSAPAAIVPAPGPTSAPAAIVPAPGPASAPAGGL